MEQGIYTIEWQKDVELEVVTDFDNEEEKVVSHNEVFRKGERVEVDILVVNDEEATVDMEFGDGGIAFSVSVTLFRRLRPANHRT